MSPTTPRTIRSTPTIAIGFMIAPLSSHIWLEFTDRAFRILGVLSFTVSALARFAQVFDVSLYVFRGVLRLTRKILAAFDYIAHAVFYITKPILHIAESIGDAAKSVFNVAQSV